MSRFRALLVIGAILSASAPSALAQEEILGGRPFTPPDQVLPMPDDWQRAGITHQTPEAVDLAIALDQQLYPSLGPFIQDFAHQRGVKIAVQNGTCGISAGALSEKAVEMGGFCCPPGATDRLPGLRYHTIGIGSLAIIAHPNAPVDDVTLRDVRAMFGGSIGDWSDLPMNGVKGGPGQPVRAVTRLHCKQRPGHWRLILDDKDRFAWTIQEVSAITDMLRKVATTPGAIGYETLWHIDRHRTEDDVVVKPLVIDGVSPRDDDALARGAYPLYRTFNITTWEPGPAHTPLADELAAYLIDRAPEIAPEFAIVPVQRLRDNGWRFDGDELVGEPVAGG